MKKILILFFISNLVFAGGEISFEKQNQKLRRFEDAQLEAVRNNRKNMVQESIEQEEDLELNLEEEGLVKPKSEKSKKKHL